VAVGEAAAYSSGRGRKIGKAAHLHRYFIRILQVHK
jgi:hypothetical protein